MDALKEISVQIEKHSPEGIKQCLALLGPNTQNTHLIFDLISMYSRSTRFKLCVKAFEDFGISTNDSLLQAVLCDDYKRLSALITSNPELIHKKYTLKSAFTPLIGINLLHVCAEFNHVNCAQVLIDNGVNVNVRADTDDFGFGGQTPIFHTVNQNLNQSKEMMSYLLSQSADLQIVLKGLIWGKDFEWETMIPSVNPISYAMMGLLPQMHRNEITIAENISKLMQHAFNIDYKPKNIPNKYLNS